MSEEKEVWREVAGWPEYEASNCGRVRRVVAATGTRIGKILKPSLTKGGYLKVSLSRYPLRVEVFIHRIVAAAFIGDIGKKLDVCHNDGDKQNNNVSNLRIDTRFGNMQDQIAFGKTGRGELHANNKYRQEVVLCIRSKYKDGTKALQLSREFSMPVSTVNSIIRRQTWVWL